MGSGFRTFSAEVLSSSNVNNYLMTQAVMSFSSTATRDSATSGSEEEGMIAYTRSDDSLWYYDSSDWQPIFTEWSTFTPTWTNLTPGSATQNARWRIEGLCMRIQLNIQLAGDSSLSGTSTYFAVPATSTFDCANATFPATGNLVAKNGTTDETGHCRVNSTGTQVLLYCGGNDITSSNPFTWGNGDSIYVDITIPAVAA